MEQHSYHIIFKKYWKAIYNFCNKKLLEEDEAKDVAQNTFIKLWHKLQDIEGEPHAKRFLYTCAKNECMNVLTTIKRRPFVELSSIADIVIEEPNFDYDVIASDVTAYIFELIEIMPLRRKQVIKLFFTGLKSHLIAKKLGITRKTALNQKLTAIAELREAIKLKYHI